MDASSAVTPTPPVPRSLHRFANPGRFLRLSGRLLPYLAVPGLVLTLAGLVWGLFLSPADWQQGDAVRIMYVHVPAAWLASTGYLSLAVASAISLVWRHPLADLAAVEIGPVGAAVHRALPGHRQPLGQADVGRVVGVGCPTDLGAGAVLPLSRPHRPGARVRRPASAAIAPAPSWR